MNAKDALMLIAVAEAIREKIENRYIYGTRIDVENINHLIVAAYIQGSQDTCTSELLTEKLLDMV